MLYSTKSKLIASFLVVALLVGGVSLFIGGQLLYKAVLSEATNRVSLDLNAAREIYLSRIKTVRSTLSIVSLEPTLQSAIKEKKIPELVSRLNTLTQQTEIDFIGVVSKEGKTICSLEKNSIQPKFPVVENPMAEFVLDRHVPVSGTVILSRQFLAALSPELADRARIKLIPTPRAAIDPAKEQTSGMALVAAIPLFDSNGLLGVIYGGILLNRDTTIVDTVRDMVFQNEIYDNRSIGTATIFFQDLRISTNVLNLNGKRAIGTRVSKEVKEHVLENGRKWIDRAFVVSDWYLTAYEPIEDIFGRIVGILYVGVLEAKYVDIRNRALTVLVLITVAGILLAIGLGYILADKMLRPVNRLIEASRQVLNGNLDPEIGPISKSEIGVLQSTFKEMFISIEERDRRRSAESESKLVQSEKQASVGRLAAGVAHEINNPLTGILTYTHMLLRRKDIEGEIRSDLQTIAISTERVRKIVKGLLDFSRQTELEQEPTEMNRMIQTTISMIENQVLVKGIKLKLYLGDNLPVLILDRTQIQSVLMNIILNAVDATEAGGSINVYTATGLSASDAGQTGVEITIADTGCGISPENLDRLFDPFFTTKETGQGTGLGLSVSFGIVQRHGGTIRVQSELGKGTRFFIWLPIKEQAE